MFKNDKYSLWQIIISSILSFVFSAVIYHYLYSKIEWGSLSDFFVGVTIYNNHNKYLDIWIYFVYLILFFVLYSLISFLSSKISKEKAKAKEDTKENKLASNTNKVMPVLQKFQYLTVIGFILLYPFDGNLYPKLIALISILVILTILSIFIRNKKGKGFSPLALAAFLFIFAFTAYSAGTAPIDDHHFGEKFTAFLMHDKFGLKYYKDIMLVHGFKDIASAWLGSFFFSMNNLQGYCLGETLHRNLILILTLLTSLFVFDKKIIYSAPILLFKVPIPSVLFTGLYLLLIKKNLLNNPLLWFILWLLLSVLISTYWTTIGNFWIISSFPAAIYVLYKLKNRKIILSLTGLFLTVLAIIYKQELFEYFVQAKYYINGTLYAFGNDFFSGYGNKYPIQIVFEWIYKLFALFFTPVLIIELFKAIKSKEKDVQKFLFLIFSLILVFVSLKYTLGRVDYGAFLRMEYISFAFFCLIIPYWIYKFRDSKAQNTAEKILVFILIFKILSSVFYTLPAEIKKIKINDNVSKSELYNIGNIKLNANEESRLTELKDFIYSGGANKTFFDLTNRGMHYLYFNKKIPVQYTSFYNSINSKQALKSLNRIKHNKPDLILVYSKNQIFDNIFPSLRVNPLYRWILLNGNYKYEKAGENIFLVKTDNKNDFSSEELKDLDFCLSTENLGFLPEVWGKSVQKLPLVKIMDNYSIQIYENEIKIIFSEPKNAADIDLLYLNSNKNSDVTSYEISINDSEAAIKCKSKSGKLLIPIDNFPSWLLSKNLKEIIIKTNEQILSPEIEFYKRKYNNLP